MGRRCPSCNKFPPVEQGDPELNIDIEDVDGKSGRITGDIRLVLNSGCCGDEIAESNQEVPDEATFEHPVSSDDEKHEVTIESESADATDRYEGRKGAPIRYQKHYYGADVTVDLKCKCGWTGQVTFKVEEAASAFDDLT